MAIPANVAAVIETRSSPPASLTPIETLAAPHAARVFRLTCADGSLWKIRQLKSEALAAEMERLTALAGRDASQVLARVGDTVLEEWLPGRVVAGEGVPDAALVERCGAMLGRLHRIELPPAPPRDGVSEALGRIEANLHAAAELRALGPDTLRAVRRTLQDFRPAHASMGVIHVDFCGENLVAGEDGRLACVDNATLRIGQHDFDLARTWYRWPLDERGRRAFLAGYETCRSAAAFREHFPFWALDALLVSVAFRARLKLPGVAQPVARLEALLADLGGQLPARELCLH